MAENSMGAADPGMLELFRAELDTHLPTLSHGLLSLEKGQVDNSQIEGMMRAAHSIKGAARIVGVSMAVQVAHAMEDCFTGAQNQQITLTSEAVDVLLNAVDVLQQICDPELAKDVNEQTIQDLLMRISQVKDGKIAKQEPPAASVTSRDVLVETQNPPNVDVVLPEVFDDGEAKRMRLKLVESLEAMPERINLDFQHVKELSVMALAVIAAFVRDAAQCRPHPEITFASVPNEIARVMRVTDLAQMIRVEAKAGTDAR